METLRLIERYSIDNERFISVPNFEKHQPGLRKDREAPSSIPGPPSNNTPEQDGSKDGETPAQVKSKVKSKSKLSIREKFVAVMLEVREEFPDLGKDFNTLFDDCVRWWESERKEVKDAKKALRNWFRKERGSREKPEDKTKAPVDPNAKYLEGERGHMVHR